MRKKIEPSQLIKTLFEKDQSDRKKIKNTKQFMNWIVKKDLRRRKKLQELIRKKLLKTPRDYFMAAMIFQHGGTVQYVRKAKEFAKKAMEFGNRDARWLYAAAIDRILMMQNKKQKFGTQYVQKNGKWQPYPINPKTTDKERKKYNVPTLKKALNRAEIWNKNKINPWDKKK